MAIALVGIPEKIIPAESMLILLVGSRDVRKVLCKSQRLIQPRFILTLS
jgi:hypothetical protein